MKIIDERSLPSLLAAAAQLGCITALVNTGLVPRYLSTTVACNLYGKDNIDQWIADEMLVFEPPRKKGGQPRLDRVNLEMLEAAKQVADCLEEYVPPHPNVFSN